MLGWKQTITGVGHCRQVGCPESGVNDAVQRLAGLGYKVPSEPANVQSVVHSPIQLSCLGLCEKVHLSTVLQCLYELHSLEESGWAAMKACGLRPAVYGLCSTVALHADSWLMVSCRQVARMEQMETAAEAKAKRGPKATIRRQLTRVHTPATSTGRHLLPKKQALELQGVRPPSTALTEVHCSHSRSSAA